LKIKIISSRRNELLKRNEIIFSLSHEESPTPSRIDIRKEIARVFKTETDKVYIRRIETVTGTTTSIGEAHIYDSPEWVKQIEPEHIIVRNNPQIKKEE